MDKTKTGRCHMLLKNGQRCKNGSFHNGLCGKHTRLAQQEEKKINAFLQAGKYAEAVVALIALMKFIQEGYEIIEPYIVMISRLQLEPIPSPSAVEATVVRIEEVQQKILEIQSAARYEEIIPIANMVFAALLEGQPKD
jgi:hypothetical protein